MVCLQHNMRDQQSVFVVILCRELVQKDAHAHLVTLCILHIQAADHPLAATNGAACHLLDPDLVKAGTLYVQPAGST